MRALELFAGIGGIALAEQMAGIEVVALSEIEEYPVKILEKNFPNVPKVFDAQEWQTEWTDQVHVLSAGARILSQSSSRLRRNDDGLSQGMDRLKCVGNAVMPEQILPIFKAIVEIEEGA